MDDPKTTAPNDITSAISVFPDSMGALSIYRPENPARIIKKENITIHDHFS